MYLKHSRLESPPETFRTNSRIRSCIGHTGKLTVVALACLALFVGGAYAKGGGGTAKPPAGNAGGGGAVPPPPPAPADPVCPIDPTQCPPAISAPVFSVNQGAIHQFTTVGFLQNATVSGVNCPGLPPSQWGGTVAINGLTITIPCNMIVQFPAATFTWADLFDPTKVTSAQTPLTSLSLPASGATFGPGAFLYPSTEFRIDGNLVGPQHIAALVYISQQSLHYRLRLYEWRDFHRERS
jgi:hypothetical protein